METSERALKTKGKEKALIQPSVLRSKKAKFTISR